MLIWYYRNILIIRVIWLKWGKVNIIINIKSLPLYYYIRILIKVYM